MYENGADIVFHAAGGSGGGVFTAAKAAGKLAIGVDSDQYLAAPADVSAYILTSMIKRVDVAVFDFIKSAADGKRRPATTSTTCKPAASDYSTSGGQIDDIKTKIDDYKQQIIDRQDQGARHPLIDRCQQWAYTARAAR